MSDFWEELMTLSGTKLQFTTAYHPQTDGQSEVTNRALEQYLRAFTYDRPNRWYDLLPWAEIALNCSFNVSIGMSPFQALYGREPPNIFATYSRPSHNQAVSDLLAEREETLHALKNRITRSQHSMAEYANRHRRDVEFGVGEQVLLKLQPYHQISVGKPLSNKLSRRYYGPYSVTERIGKVAYRLQLPADSRIHNVFHVSVHKKFVPSIEASTTLPPEFHQGRPFDVPVRASAARTVLIDNIPTDQWLVHWASTPNSQPTWECASTLRSHFPHLHLEDKAAVKGGGVDRDSTPEHVSTSQPTSSNPTQADPSAAAPQQQTKTQTKKDNKTKNVQPTKERPKRNAPKPAKYRD